MTNNGNEFIAQIKQDLIDQFKKDSSGYNNKIDQIQQSAIEDMQIPDTGFLAQKTFTKFTANLSSNIIAEATFTTRGVKYAGYVISGTKRFATARNYLQTARDQTLELIKTGSYTKVFKQGGKSKGGRKIARRK